MARTARQPSSSPSVFSVPDSNSGSESDFEGSSAASTPPARGTKRKSASGAKGGSKRVPAKRKPASTPSTDIAGPSKSGALQRVPAINKRQKATNGNAPKRHQGDEDEETIIDGEDRVEDIEDLGGKYITRVHGMEYHAVDDIVRDQERLLAWFKDVREKRGMPWRKPYDPTLSMEEKGQRAYEIWVSEVMLQQTQVATVIAYWRKWIDKWPTVADLAKADVEEVNAMWRGLGYYRRARSLLAGAKTVMSHKKYKGRLPDDPAVLEKEIDGVGRYTAGAICSMAYGVRTPIVDGNIHRLFTRLLAVHAPQTAPSTIKFLWFAAEQLVGWLPIDEEREGIAGDWNQALMELGSQICKPVSPDCGSCPLQPACKGYAETKQAPPTPEKEECTLCAPIPVATSSCSSGDGISSVQIFPMKKEKKVSRDEEESVLVLEWQGLEGMRRWLFVKRPEKGLLAGLFEPPTTPVPSSSTPQQCLEASLAALTEYIDIDLSAAAPRAVPDPTEKEEGSHRRHIGSIPHIFSHINMTYHIHHYILTTPTSTAQPPAILETAPRQAVWLDEQGVEHANVGTGVKKVWSEIYGSWGKFEVGVDRDPKPKSNTKKKTTFKKTAKTTTTETIEEASNIGKVDIEGANLNATTIATTTRRGTKTREVTVKRSIPKLEIDDVGKGNNGKIVKRIMMPLMPVRTKMEAAE